MAEIIIICIAAFLTSILTFFSGFGLGTILMPVFASFAGAWLLMQISGFQPLLSYGLEGKQFEVTPVKLVIAVLLLFFSLFWILPRFQKIQFGKNKLILGGFLSGFFGGLTGIQGALRSAFLIKSGLSKEAYIATGVVIASLVDITRLSVYSKSFFFIRPERKHWFDCFSHYLCCYWRDYRENVAEKNYTWFYSDSCGSNADYYFRCISGRIYLEN